MFCAHYIQLNKIINKDVNPLPRMDDTLDTLHHANHTFSIAMPLGYWKISVDEKDREKTTFVTFDGPYQF